MLRMSRGSFSRQQIIKGLLKFGNDSAIFRGYPQLHRVRPSAEWILATVELSLRFLKQVDTYRLLKEAAESIGELRRRLGVGACCDEDDVLTLDLSNDGSGREGNGTDRGGTETIPRIGSAERRVIGSDKDCGVRKHTVGALRSQSDRHVAILQPQRSA